jgi:small subunit ribosomal protein S7
MSRKKKSNYKRREIAPDYLYNSALISKFINYMMYHGKKSLNERILYQCLELLKNKYSTTPVLELFDKAIAAVRPLVEVRSRRVGGATYQIPMEIPKHRSIKLSMCWIIKSARTSKGHNMIDNLYNEFVNVLEEKGSALKKRDDVHKMAEANKAFAHYHWNQKRGPKVESNT